MLSSLGVLLLGALLCAFTAYWVLRAYRRAGGGGRNRRSALALCAVTALAALGLYLFNGRPELPDAPFEPRLAALKQRDPTSYSAEEALAVLQRAARENPADALAHLYAGQILLDQGRAPEAARAFDAALRRAPENAEALLGLGRALVRNEGRVTPEALALFQQAAERTNDPAPWIFLAMAAMEDGRAADARASWAEAARRMRPDDPRLAMAREMSATGGER